MAVTIGLAEFLEKVGKLSKNVDKVNAIRANDSIQIRILLQGAYDPTVVWDLPPGVPPYKKNELQDQEHVLIRDVEKLRYFVKGFADKLTPQKKEMMFVEMLERLAPKDSELLCAIKDKKPIKGITVATVREALPGCLQSPPLVVEDTSDEKEVDLVEKVVQVIDGKA